MMRGTDFRIVICFRPKTHTRKRYDRKVVVGEGNIPASWTFPCLLDY